MAADEQKMRTELRTLLDGVDLAAMSIGKLRGSLEQALGLPAGALDSKKEQVTKMIQEELKKVVEKKRKSDEKADGESASKKEKKKDKKEKSEKKEKKEKEKEKEMPINSAAADVPATPEKAQPVEAEQDPNVGLSLFDDFSASVPKAGARVMTWAVSGAEDGHLRLWDLENYTCVRALEGHVGAIRAVVVDWEDMLALSGGDDGARLWSLKRGGCLRTFAVQEGCLSVAADWKGSFALGGCGDGQIKLWNSTTGDTVNSTSAHKGGVYALAADFQAQRAVSGGDEALKVWDTSDWTCLHNITNHPGGIMSLATDFANSRALVTTGHAESNLRLWGFEKRSVKNLPGHSDAVACVRVDWEADLAFSGGWDAQLRIWNISKGTDVSNHECKFGRIRSMAADFTQMQALCGSSAGTLHFVDAHSGAELRRLDGHVGAVLALQAKF